MCSRQHRWGLREMFVSVPRSVKQFGIEKDGQLGESGPQLALNVEKTFWQLTGSIKVRRKVRTCFAQKSAAYIVGV
jgi:hypothetical protein